MWDLWWTKWHWGSFLRVFRFPLSSIPPIAPHSSSSIIRGCYHTPIVANVPSPLCITPSQETKKKIHEVVLTKAEMMFAGHVSKQFAKDIFI
jgi:hypothetical protein